MKKPNASCVACGREMWTNYVGNVKPCCHPCRRALPLDVKIDLGVVRRKRAITCEWCGVEFHGKSRRRFCGLTCSAKANAKASGRDRSRSRKAQRYFTRYDRSMAAPGLKAKARTHLLREWQRSGRSCFFCPAWPDTVDHLIPLARGGTNYEGNLVPCCKRCNSSRSDLLVVEWRLGRPHGGTVDRRPWLAEDLVTKRKPRKQKPQRAVQAAIVFCDMCGDGFTSNRPTQKRHPGRCANEYTARVTRSRYRAAHGIPDDPMEPTKPFRRYLEELSRAAA